MESQYNPSEIETRWNEYWKTNKSFAPSGQGETYSIVIPPPNVTGALHLGHALNNTIQDILTRYKRKKGFDVLWIPGTDHAGIATQAVVEKRLLETEKKTRHDIGRKKLVEKIWNWKDEYEERICNQLKMLGCSCDWDHQRFTLDEMCTKAVRHTFFHLFKKGLVYRGKRLVNWDAHLQTAVADDEIYYETVPGHMWYFKYPLSDGSGHLPVATTRPETILGDTAVAVHPDDERYKHLIGQMLMVPFVNREIPIIADGQLVDPEFGTGCVKVTPAHDPNDYDTGLRHDLPMINILEDNGFINQEGGPYAGLERYKARKKIVEDLESEGLLTKVDDHEIQLGHSDRSKTPIEPYLSDQWFVAMSKMADQALDVVRKEKVKFTPKRYAKTYLDWLGEKRDWCISRQLWWGHRIPIWYCDTCTEEELRNAFGNQENIHWINTPKGFLICIQEGDLDTSTLKGHTLRQDDDVLDTWFSSALWPMSTLGWPESTSDLSKYYPTSILITGRDIISLWVARMVIFGLENMKEIPFHDVFINPTILDGKGQRMSKSKGNGVDPLDIISKYGTDALRFTMTQLCTENQDAKLPVTPEKQADGSVINTSERFEQGRNFANKLWNACRFVHPHLADKTKDTIDESLLALEDKWILSRINSTVKSIESCLDNYRFAEAMQILYHFTWDDFCSRYLEIRKKVLTAEGSSDLKDNVLNVFLEVLNTLLNILNPIMPFITEELNAILFGNESDVVSGAWPEYSDALIDLNIEASFQSVFNIVEGVRSIRGQYSISPAKELECKVLINSKASAQQALENKNIIGVMGKLSDLEIGNTVEKPGFSATHIIPNGEIYIPLEGILDKDKELDKLNKELEKAEKFAAGIEKKLSNERFVNNAPTNVVQNEKEKLKNQLEIIEKCKKSISELA